jgi:hypothetical protein
MIRIDQELSIEGVTVYRDEVQRNTFYVLPNQPRFRLDDSGKPVFKFIKYRDPIDKPDGSKGGGFVIFDSEFVVPEDKMTKVQKALDALVQQEGGKGSAQIGDFTFTRGTATLNLLDSGDANANLVEKVQSAAKPSLFGNNVCCFSAELSPTGATVIEAAMQGAGGIAQVTYDLNFITKIPEIGGHVWFFEDKFYSYYQTIDKSDDHWWSGNNGSELDKRREQFSSSDSGGVDLNFNWVLPDPDQDTKLKNSIRDWGWSALDDAVKRLTLSDPTANTDNGLPDGVHHVTRDFSTDKTASFDRYFRESDAVEWHVVPNGTLPNITSLPGIKWSDYSIVIDGIDPFFQTLHLNVGINADFDKFGIDSVDLEVKYNGATLKPLGKDKNGFDIAPHFTSGDQRVAFEQYIANNSWKYSYSYLVNFKDDSRVFNSGSIDSDANVLTIDVGDLGVLSVQIFAGSIDWKVVASAEVNLTYADASNNVDPISYTAHLSKDVPTDHWRAVIMARQANPVQFTVKYNMVDGTSYTDKPKQSSANQLYIDDPFGVKVVHVRGLYDFDNTVDTVFIDLTYKDATTGMATSTTFALKKGNTFADWTFTTITGSTGQVQYSGMVRNKDNTQTPIAMTTAASDTIYLGDGDVTYLTVTVVPDLIDWTKVKLATVALAYADPANGINAQTTIPVKSGTTPAPWKVACKDPTKNKFTWSATYYLSDANNTHLTSAAVTTSDTVVVLQLPAS